MSVNRIHSATLSHALRVRFLFLSVLCFAGCSKSSQNPIIGSWVSSDPLSSAPVQIEFTPAKMIVAGNREWFPVRYDISHDTIAVTPAHGNSILGCIALSPKKIRCRGVATAEAEYTKRDAYSAFADSVSKIPDVNSVVLVGPKASAGKWVLRDSTGKVISRLDLQEDGQAFVWQSEMFQSIPLGKGNLDLPATDTAKWSIAQNDVGQNGLCFKYTEVIKSQGYYNTKEECVNFIPRGTDSLDLYRNQKGLDQNGNEVPYPPLHFHREGR